MYMRKKRYTIRFVNVGTPEQSTILIKRIVRNELQKTMSNHGVTIHNLDEILDRYFRA